MERLSSTSSMSQSSIVQIEAMERHGYSGYGGYRDPKPFDIKEGSGDRIINIYANFPDKKPYRVYKEVGYWLDKHLIIDVGMHIKIPKGYALYVFSDNEIISKYGIRLYNEIEIFTGYRFPFQICITYDRNMKKITIDDGQLVARACIIPFPKVDILNLTQCKKISIKTNIPIGEKGCCISGGSGWTKPINTNSRS